MMSLPRLMVAPNGARKTKADHPALPVTIQETVEAAKACFDAGADGLHAHLRDADQKHVLDAGHYQELLAELRLTVPKMQIQITTEAVGQYQPPEQIALVKQVMPESVSVSTKELLSTGDQKAAADFYVWAHDQHIAVQHILYDTNDLATFYHLCIDHNIDHHNAQLLFVLGALYHRPTKRPVNAHAVPAPLGRNRYDCRLGCVCLWHQRNGMPDTCGSIRRQNAHRF